MWGSFLWRAPGWGFCCTPFRFILIFPAIRIWPLVWAVCLAFCYHENFRYPYLSTSVTDFGGAGISRWAFSFRDYVYIPLGGNRRHQLRNILIVWALTGLWHGASWNFVAWGLYYGCMLLIEKKFLLGFLREHRLLGWCYMAVVVLWGWALFFITPIWRSCSNFYWPFWACGPALFCGICGRLALCSNILAAAGAGCRRYPLSGAALAAFAAGTAAWSKFHRSFGVGLIVCGAAGGAELQSFSLFSVLGGGCDEEQGRDFKRLSCFGFMLHRFRCGGVL